MSVENDIFLVAAVFYGWAVLAALFPMARFGKSYTFPLSLLGLALGLTALSLGLRWVRLGHGPYVDFRETMISGVFGYHLAVFLACLFFRPIMGVMKTILPVLFLLVIWSLLLPSKDSLLPITYNTYWLPVHIIFGKIFIGCAIVALGMGIAILIRAGSTAMAGGGAGKFGFEDLPSDDVLEELAFRFMLFGFVCHTMMLISGAVWAQDAWGRYWDWDPLETWSFITWLFGVAYLHIRVTRRPMPSVSAVFICLVFGFGFFTFFGVPFISTAAHKGMV